MKIRKAIKIALVIHILLWVAVFGISIIGRVTYKNPQMEPLELYMTKGVYTVFSIIAVAGIVNSALLSFSLRTVLAASITKIKVLEKVALIFSILSNILFICL